MLALSEIRLHKEANCLILLDRFYACPGYLQVPQSLDFRVAFGNSSVDGFWIFPRFYVILVNCKFHLDLINIDG